MSKMTSKDKIIAAVVVIFLLVASYFLVIAPRLAQPVEIDQQTLQQEERSASVAQRQKVLEDKQSAIPNLREQVTKMNTRFPSKFDGGTANKYVTSRAVSVGIPAKSITSVTASSPQKLGSAASGDAAVDANVTALSGSEAFQVSVSIQVATTPEKAGQLASALQTGDVSMFTLSVNGSEASGTNKVMPFTIDAITVLLPPM
jgi:hypothetical protein